MGLNLIQRFLPARTETQESYSSIGPLSPKVLVVSADVRFYAKVLNAVNSRVWQVDWARSAASALDLCRNGQIPIILFDEDLPWTKWRDAFRSLRSAPGSPRLLLAARSLDETLWCAVIFHDGYDAVPRFAEGEHLRRVLRFAWMSFCNSNRSSNH